MKAKLSLKTLYRSPVRTILTFILLAAVTFALFSQVLEYSIADREMKKAVEQYDGVLSVWKYPPGYNYTGDPLYMFTDPRVSTAQLPEYFQEEYPKLKTKHLDSEIIEEISSIPYVTYVDTRYMTAGYSDEYRRVDEGPKIYDYANQCVVEATVKYTMYGSMILSDVKLLGGTPKRAFKDEDIIVWCEKTADLESFAEYYAASLTSDEEKFKAIYETYLDKNITYNSSTAERAVHMASKESKYGNDFIPTLEKGARYVFVLRYEDYITTYTDAEQYYLTDPFVSEYCDGVIPLAGKPSNYMETEEFEGVRRYIERIERNDRTFDVVYTKNMGAIRYLADRTIGISEGRLITMEDYENKANVCVIHHDMAQELGLRLGDTITLKLGDKLFEQYAGKGAIDVSPAQAPENLTEVTLEIVGIFKDTRSDELVKYDAAWSYSANNIFVPLHLLSVSDEELENHTFTPAEVSFVIENAWDIPAFTEEYLPEIQYASAFSDSGWSNLVEGYRDTERLALIKLGVLAASVFVSTCFVAFLYIVGKRQDYAIMRVLGTSKKKAGSALLLPLFVLALVAVLAGGISAIFYTQKTILSSDSLQYLSGIISVDTSIPPITVIGCILGEIALTLLIAEFLLILIGKNSPLALIQAQTQKQNKRTERKNRKKKTVVESTEPIILGQWIPLEKAKHDGKKRKLRFAVKYIFRHIRRTKGKAVMLVLVTVLLLSVAGQLLIMDYSYNKIFEETEIFSNYAGYLNLKYVNDLRNSGYVENIYYIDTNIVSVYSTPCTMYMTSDISRTSEGFVEWADGYDSSVMESVGNVVVLSRDIMREQNLELGQTVRISRAYVLTRIRNDYYQAYLKEFDDSTGEQPYQFLEWSVREMPLVENEINAEFEAKSHEFKIVGIIDCPSEYVLFTPGSMDVAPVYGKLAILDVIEATLIDNWKAEEYREYGEALAAANLTGEIAFIMDTSKLDNVLNNIKLMDTLFPIIITAILVIGAFLCGLLIVQTSKDIAIMRVLGTSKRRVRLIMIIEHSALCFVGIVLATAIMLFRKADTAAIINTVNVSALYFAAILLASIIASVAASRKNVLELLQTKE